MAQKVPVAKEHFTAGAGILQYLTAEELALTVRDLATLMIVLSDNTATNLLIDLLGMDSVNRSLRDLGFPKLVCKGK